MLYGGEPIICEECGIVLEEASGYTCVQFGICDECLAKIEAAQHSVELTFDSVGEKPTVSKSYPNELPA